MRSATKLLRRPVAPVSFRPIALIALSAPFFLTACVSNQAGTKTSTLEPKNQAGTPSVDAYGYAPVRIAAFTDGSRVAQPSQKPNLAKLATSAKSPDDTTTVAADKTARLQPAKAAAEPAPATEVAALQADVAERKATTQAPEILVIVPDDVVARAAVVAAQKRPSALDNVAAVASALNPVEVVPATVAAVADTAEAVTVAAVENTAKAYNAVTERFGDTFSGTDTITGSASIDKMIERAAADNNIPSELAYAVVRVESHYNPKAKGSGVYGLSQIQPATARSLGFSGQPSDLYDPETNLRYGMKYLAGAWQQSGHDVCGAAMKYKGGHRTTRMSRSAAAYCANVKRHMAAIERRRGPVNAGTLVAANERQKQIVTASRPESSARAAIAAAGKGAVETAKPARAPAQAAAATQVAATPGAIAPLPGVRPAAAPLAVASTEGGRGGRIIGTSKPVAASLGLTD